MGLPANPPELPTDRAPASPLSTADSESERLVNDTAATPARKQQIQDSNPGQSELWPGPSLGLTAAKGQPRMGRPQAVSSFPSVPGPSVGVCKSRGAGGYRQGNWTPWEARSQRGSSGSCRHSTFPLEKLILCW